MTRVLSPLRLEYIDGRRWLLLEDFAYESVHIGQRTVTAGTVTDFNSIPRLLWRLLPPTEYGEAGVAHDDLYVSGDVPRKIADKVHREFVTWRNDAREAEQIASGETPRVPRWKERAMYCGLRLGGWRSWRKHRAREAATV